jgi:hypothetical protein
MLGLRILNEPAKDAVNLAQLEVGEVRTGRLWQLERRWQLSEVHPQTVPIPAYWTAVGTKLTDAAAATLGVYAQDLCATHVCDHREQPQPLLWQTTLPPIGTGTVVVRNEAGELLSEDRWHLASESLTQNAVLYLPSSGPWQISLVTDGQTQDLNSRVDCVLRSRSTLGDGYGDPLAVSYDTTAGKYVVTYRQLPVADILDINYVGDATPGLVVGATTLQLVEDAVTVRTISLTGLTASALANIIGASQGWSATLRCPGFVRVDPSGFLVTGTFSDLSSCLQGRLLFVACEHQDAFEIELPDLGRNDYWYPRVHSGQFITEETLTEAQGTLIKQHLNIDQLGDPPANTLVDSRALALWEANPAIERQYRWGVSEGQVLAGLTDWIRPIDTQQAVRKPGVARETEDFESLVPEDSSGVRWRTVGRSIESILEVIDGSTLYSSAASVFSHIDYARGRLVSRWSLTAPKIRYRHFDNSVWLSGWVDPVRGQVRRVELNPRFMDTEDRGLARIIILTPWRMRVFMGPTGDTDRYTVVVDNPSCLRVITTDNPARTELELASHEGTRLLLRTGIIQLPYRVLGVLYYSPDLGPSQVPVTPLTTEGGELLTNWRELASAEDYEWAQIITPRVFQLNGCLAIRLPLELKNRLGEAEVRRRIDRVLAVTAFYTIDWY